MTRLSVALVVGGSLSFATTTPSARAQEPEQPAQAPPKEDPSDDPMLDEELLLLEEDVPDNDEPVVAKPYAPMPELHEVTLRYSPEDIFRMGGSVQVLDEKQLEKFQYDDPNTVLMQVPGVYVRQEDGFGLRPNIGLRGTNSNRSSKITLMEDGVLFAPAPYSAPGAYYFPIITRMTGVEVFKGPAAILYGPNTIGGAINLLTRPVPEEAGGKVDVAYGRFQSMKAYVRYGARNDWGGYLVEGIHLGSAGFKQIDSDFGTDNTGFQRSELMLKGYVNTKADKRVFNRLELKFTASRERSNEGYLGLADADFAADPYQRYAASQLDNMQWWRTAVQLRHDLQVGDHVTLETTAYRQDFQRAWERVSEFRDGPSFLSVLNDPTGPRLPFYEVLTGARNSASVENPAETGQDLLTITTNRKSVAMGVQTRLRADFDTGPLEHEIEAGVRLHYDSNDRFHPNVGYQMQNRQLVFDGITIDDDPGLIGADRKAEALALASYLMYGLRARGLTMKPGVRIEYIRTFFEDEGDPRGRVTEKPQLVALPGLGLQYAIGDAFAVLAGAYRGFSPVSPRNREMADPELSINYEAGGRYVSKSGSGFAEVIGFFNDYSNITSVCTVSAGCDPDQIDRQFNGGRAFIGGVETLGGYTIALPRAFSMPLRVTYTYTSATFRTSFVSRDSLFGDVTKGDEIPYVPRHVLNAQVGLEKGIWSTYLNGTYFGSMREGQVGTVDLPRTDSYFVLDVVGRVRFERVEAYVRLQNVTNTRAIVSRRPFGARPNLPFSAQVGLQVSF